MAEVDGDEVELQDGSVVIAAITSCTNTSNPQVMLGAALLAKKAVERGLQRKPWVKSSLAPGSRVVTDYYDKAGLTPYLEQLGFNTVGYGCTTCIGNSGPLPEPISAAVEEGDLVVCAVLSGNRNFEARIHPEVKANYLASPPLVVAYALAGRMDLDLETEPIGQGSEGEDVFLRDLWPTNEEIDEAVATALDGGMFRKQYADVFTGDERWQALPIPEGDLYDWSDESTYIRRPPFFEGMPTEPEPLPDVEGARCLVSLGDSVTTDHISPAGSIKPESPAGEWLIEHGVERKFFNSYGARRGNHEIMVRGTFANVRLRNLLVPESEGTWTVHVPSGEEMTIYAAAERYREEGTPLIVLAGKEYGSGSSRDWAAKGPDLLGVRAAIAESYERIHRSNLLMCGIVPLQFMDGESLETLGLTGREEFSITGLENGRPRRPRSRLTTRSSASASGSRRRRNASTSATAGSSSTCSAASSQKARRLPPRPASGASTLTQRRYTRSSRVQTSHVAPGPSVLHWPIFVLDGVEERQHALGQRRCGRGVVRRQRRVGEEVLVTRVEEQLGPVGRGDQGAGGLEILGEERVGLLAVHLHRDALGPRVSELRDRETGVHQHGAPGAGPGLRELLGGHHPEGEAGVDQLRCGAPRPRPRPARQGRRSPPRPRRPCPPRSCRTCARRTGPACARCAPPAAGRRRTIALHRSAPGRGGTARPRPSRSSS